jgi:hypothetical protein
VSSPIARHHPEVLARLIVDFHRDLTVLSGLSDSRAFFDHRVCDIVKLGGGYPVMGARAVAFPGDAVSECT